MVVKNINTVLYTQVREGQVINPPTRAYDNDAGWDLACSEDMRLPPNTPTKIPTSIRIALPNHLWCRIVGRSSTIWEYNVQMLEGIIDTGWRGELFMVAINHGHYEIDIPKWTRLGQIIFHRRVDVGFIYQDDLPESERGEKGFGSSGK